MSDSDPAKPADEDQTAVEGGETPSPAADPAPSAAAEPSADASDPAGGEVPSADSHRDDAALDGDRAEGAPSPEAGAPGAGEVQDIAGDSQPEPSSGERSAEAEGRGGETAGTAAAGEGTAASEAAPAAVAAEATPTPQAQIQRRDADTEVDEAWFANFAEWVKTHRMLSLLMFFVVFVAPFGVNTWHQNRIKGELYRALDAWHGELLEAGLPIPFVPPKDLPLPSGFPQASDDMFAWAGNLERKEYLSAWRERLGGGAPAMPRSKDPWAAAVRVCLKLHRAEAGEAEALDSLVADLDASPMEIRPVLDLAVRLVRGEQGVAGRALELLQEPPPGCKRPLNVILYEARRRQIQATLAARPPTKNDVAELARMAKAGALVLPEALEVATRDQLLGVLSVGDGDLERADSLIETFATLRAKPAGVRLEQSWQAVVEGAGVVLAQHWSDPKEPIEPPLKLLATLLAAEPQADVPLTALSGWRDHLQTVINDSRRLGYLARKLLELGYVPRTLEAVLLDADVPAGDTPGLALMRALQASLAFERGTGEAPDPALWTAVEESVAGRADPIAQRVLAQRAFRGAVDARFQGGEGASGWVSRARTRGYTPAYRLLAEESYALAAGAQDTALQSALRDLDSAGELPDARLSMKPARAQTLESQGRPTSKGGYELERSRLLALRGLHAFHNDQLDKAGLHAVTALQAARTAAAYEVMALMEQSRGRAPQAFTAVRNALKASPTPRERARLEALQKSLTPR